MLSKHRAVRPYILRLTRVRGVPFTGEALGFGELGEGYGSGVGRALGFGY